MIESEGNLHQFEDGHLAGRAVGSIGHITGDRKQSGRIQGIVRRGQQLGRKLGFPTANVHLEHRTLYRFGVYATKTRLADGREYPGAANIGENPTTGLVAPRLEVFLFDFDEDIYGQWIDTHLVAFLRPELKFSDLGALVVQMTRDAAEARNILAACRAMGSGLLAPVCR